MVRSTAAYYTFNFHPRARKNPRVGRSVLDVESGKSILAFLCSYMDYLIRDKKGVLRDSYKRSVSIVRSYEIHGRSVLVDVESGYFGDESKLVKINNGDEVRKIGADESPVRNTRLLFACPRIDYPTAIVGIEIVDSNSALLLLETFAKMMRKQFPDCFCPVKPILEKEIWLQQGKLKEMSISVSANSQEIVLDDGTGNDGGRDVEIGELTYVIRPKSGIKYFPDFFWKKLQRRKIDGAGILTLPAVFEDKSLSELTIMANVEGPNGSTKKVLLGDKKYPRVRELLTDHGEPLLNSSAIFKKLSESIYEKYLDSGFRLQNGWDNGNELDETLPEDVSWDCGDEREG